MNNDNVIHTVLVILAILIWLLLWGLAVVSILRRPGVSGFERGVWITVAIIFPFLGPLVWAIWGRNRARAEVKP
jgi:hypothetical protein